MKNKTDAEIFQEQEYERRFGDDPHSKIDRLKNHGFVQNESGEWFQQIGDEFYKIERTYLTELLNDFAGTK